MKKKDKDLMHIEERRKFIRHPLCFPLKYKVIKNSKNTIPKTQTQTLNISCGGLLFSSKSPVKEGLQIVIQMPVQDKVFNIRAKVLHCKKSLESKLYNIGVKFQRLSDAFKVKLIEQIYLIIEYRELRSLELGKEISLAQASQEWVKHYSERFERLYW